MARALREARAADAQVQAQAQAHENTIGTGLPSSPASRAARSRGGLGNTLTISVPSSQPGSARG